MQILLTYILKVALFQALLVAFYLLVLRKDTFFKINRMYLVSSIFFSLIAPLIEINMPGQFQWKENQHTAYDYVSQFVVVYESTAQEVIRPSLSFNDYALLLILAGMVFMLIRSVIQLFSLYRIKTTHIEQKDGYKLAYLAEEIQPFSFGKTIYINPDKHSQEEITEIIEHELVHIRQHHSIDIMISLANKCLFWWNPASWILHKAIQTNLEYIADGQMIQKGFERKRYQYHLLQISLSSASNNPLVNSFSFISNLKNRIYMMNKQQTTPFFKMKWLLAIPICIVVVLACNRNINVVTKKAGNAPLKGPLNIDSVLQSSGNADLIGFKERGINIPIYLGNKITLSHANRISMEGIESVNVRRVPEGTSIHIRPKFITLDQMLAVAKPSPYENTMELVDIEYYIGDKKVTKEEYLKSIESQSKDQNKKRR